MNFSNDPFLIIIFALSVLNLILLIALWLKFKGYQKVQDEILSGGEVDNLEEAILKNRKTLKNHAKNLKEIGDILNEIIESNRGNIQKVGLVRFNPFEDTGSNMSFALALLDGNSDGFVVSSLHSREGTRIYSKAVEAGKSKHNLTDEEKQAIKQAVGNQR